MNTGELYGIVSASAIIQLRSGGIRLQDRNFGVHAGVLIFGSPRAISEGVDES
jgi:hypothetical protein